VEIKRRLDKGRTLYDLAGMKALYEAAGFVEIDAI
jgi:4-hydroxy-4-methyl-2-oxoglutarate aldolase